MTDRNRQVRNASQATRTAADVLAEGWQDGEDFEISFIATDTRSQQTPTRQSGQQQPVRRS